VIRRGHWFGAPITRREKRAAVSMTLMSSGGEFRCQEGRWYVSSPVVVR